MSDSSVAYEYEDSSLKKITTPSGTVYNFIYDEFLNVTDISVGNQSLSHNTYLPNNGQLSSTVYGNGDIISFTYDSLDRIKEKLYNDVVKVKYTYDKSGRLYEKHDIFSGVTTRYVYDISGRVTSAKSSDGIRIVYDYDQGHKGTVLLC